MLLVIGYCLFQGGFELTVLALCLMPVFILIFSFGKGVMSTLFAQQRIRSVGNLTYGVYLLHAPLLVYLRSENIVPYDADSTPVAMGMLILSACTLLSIPLYYFFEVPCKKGIIAGMQWLRSRSQGATPAGA